MISVSDRSRIELQTSQENDIIHVRTTQMMFLGFEPWYLTLNSIERLLMRKVVA